MYTDKVKCNTFTKQKLSQQHTSYKRPSLRTDKQFLVYHSE